MAIGDPAGITARAYSPFGTIVTESFTNNKILEGRVYGLAQRFDLAKTAFLDFIFDTSAVTKDFIIFLPFVVGAGQAGPINIDIFTDTVYSGGTAVPVQNRNLTSSNVAETVVTTGATVSDIGTLFAWEYNVLSNGTAAVAKAGSEGGSSLITVVDQGRVIRVRLTNTDIVSTAKCTFAFDWFEFDELP